MGERPILFTDEMVLAILAGRKTVTRRVGPTWAGVQPGTVLWVRECWGRHVDGWVAYRATDDAPDDRSELEGYRWRPSIHMPRWACRLRLVVESVTVERSVLGGGLGQMAVLMPGVTDDEARLEGFADRGAFLDLWRELYPDYNGPVYRVAFHVPEVTRG